MKGRITLTMIKPHAIEDGNLGNILAKIQMAGFKISALKMLRLRLNQAQEFYKIHEGRDFYKPLTEFMSNGPIVAAILEKDNAVEDFRKLIGATDPSTAQEGTIRKLFGLNTRENAVHGSDSDENARIEADFFFSLLERY
ncbi:MAG: nucleoside-diphosphate kinase [Bacteroidales bacterium]|nr:nucleoside-diphosphate kinase [Bacteroidales bacterium]